MSSILTIGNFDGLHIGHRHLISTTVALAKSWAARAVAITFTPHPRQFFHPVSHFFLHPEHVKEQILESLGLDEVIYLPFGDIYRLTPEQFFNNILLPLEPAAIVLGSNFIFGADKTGDIHLLRQFCAQHDIALHSLSMEPWQGAAVSSTRIRTAIQTGCIEDAAQMLGSPYTIYGCVHHGAQRGRTLGFATANIQVPDQVIPKFGAYATRIQIDGTGPLMPAMTAVTQTPTFCKTQTVIESHILDFNGDIYNHHLTILFDAFLRDEIRFGSKEELIAQLQKDCQTVRNLNSKGIDEL